VGKNPEATRPPGATRRSLVLDGGGFAACGPW
jgi:hypothetical protein